MPFNRASYGEMSILLLLWRISWKGNSTNPFKSFVSTNLLSLKAHLFTPWKVDTSHQGRFIRKPQPWATSEPQEDGCRGRPRPGVEQEDRLQGVQWGRRWTWGVAEGSRVGKILKLSTLKRVVPNIFPKMILLTTIQVVLRGQGTRDPPNPKTFQRFFGGGLPKRLERGPRKKPLWRKQLRAAEKHDAAVAREQKYNRVINRLAASAALGPKSEEVVPEDFVPATPVISNLGGVAWWKPVPQRQAAHVLSF